MKKQIVEIPEVKPMTLERYNRAFTDFQFVESVIHVFWEVGADDSEKQIKLIDFLPLVEEAKERLGHMYDFFDNVAVEKEQEAVA